MGHVLPQFTESQAVQVLICPETFLVLESPRQRRGPRVRGGAPASEEGAPRHRRGPRVTGGAPASVPLSQLPPSSPLPLRPGTAETSVPPAPVCLLAPVPGAAASSPKTQGAILDGPPSAVSRAWTCCPLAAAWPCPSPTLQRLGQALVLPGPGGPADHSAYFWAAHLLVPRTPGQVPASSPSGRPLLSCGPRCAGLAGLAHFPP